MDNSNNTILGFSVAFLFAVLYIVGALTSLEDRFYDFFLGFRSNRDRIDSVVFLDINDEAIAYYGVFPWPRSIPADGLLRLKEYGARAAIFDIEYIDRGPQGIDSIYLDYGLESDFLRSFSDISLSTQELLSAIQAGQIARNDINLYEKELFSMISDEQKSLFEKAKSVARDNDIYLAQAIALNGRSWSTLNLREHPLDGEQAERYAIAQDRFAYPVKASPAADLGAGFVDILPALPIFAQPARGAGFTNVEIDKDGVRRRVFLAQNINDHWYLQLSFAPLACYFGNPEIVLEKTKLIIKQAKMRDGKQKDIVIPLDSKGRMMLDWPKENYENSYTHRSFAFFCLLDEMESEIEKYTRALSDIDFVNFTQFDSSFSAVPRILSEIRSVLDESLRLRNEAMENRSDDSFNDFLEYRNYAYELLDEIIDLDIAGKAAAVADDIINTHPQYAGFFAEEAEYIKLLIETININLSRHREISFDNENIFRGKFVILGRVDTGTTDYGANSFYGKYINVGTHGVVLDTILSESFIIPLSFGWSIFLLFIIIPLFLHFSANLSPVIRALCGFGAVLFILISSILLFRLTGIFAGIIGLVLAMIIVIITREIMSYAHSEKEKHFIRSAFSTYVSGDIVKEIITDPSRLQLGGSKRYMTAIFTDVKNFSTISEKLGDPTALVSLLNKYLSAMSDVILSENGTIDKYEGDAIIAFFGAPLDLNDHALRACVSAIKMKKIEADLNKIILEQNLSPLPLVTRIGINTGFMVAGNMGTDKKMNYTIMGNAVNLAARLEGVNKQYGTWILASEQTVRETGDALLYRRLDRVRVVGINEPVRLCELIDMTDTASEQEKKLVSVFHEALNSFEKRSWKAACDCFKEALIIKSGDEPSKMYLERSEQFLITPPDDNWDGVYNLASK